MHIHRSCFLLPSFLAGLILLAPAASWNDALYGQTLIQLEDRADFETTYRTRDSLELILVSRRALELSRLLASSLAHADATGDSGYRRFFESLRGYRECIRRSMPRTVCYRQGPPRERPSSAIAGDRFQQLKGIYYNAFYRILQVQGRARRSLETRKLKPASEAFELQNEIMRSFSLNREHSIDRMTIQLLRRLPADTALQPIPDDSLYIIFLRALASLPQAKLQFRENHDHPALTSVARVNRLKAFLRKNGLRQVLFRVPGSLRNLASNM